MKNLKYSLGSLVTILLLTGCSSKSQENNNNNQIVSISENEAFKYEKQYLAEYEKIKEQNKNIETPFKWIQPKNKKEQCKVYVSINPNDDKTLKSDYVLYWDGECKDGYAFGLGREIEKTMFTELNQIGIYETGKAIDYCVFSKPLDGVLSEGECSYSLNKPNHEVITTINDKQGNLEVTYKLRVSGSLSTPEMLIETSPFSPIMTYIKGYSNFGYVLQNFENDEFDNRNSSFRMLILKNGQKIENGFSFLSMKQGEIITGEIVNNKLQRRVQLPQSYFNNLNNILREIQTHANIALEAQKKAQIIKERYKSKICKDSVKVSFMDNQEYKSICKEDEKNAQLKAKIDAKLAQIEQQKQAKRAQLNQERLIQTQELNNVINMTNQMNQMNQINSNNSLNQITNSMKEMNYNNNQNYQNYQFQQLNNNLNNLNNNLNNNTYKRGWYK